MVRSNILHGHYWLDDTMAGLSQQEVVVYQLPHWKQCDQCELLVNEWYEGNGFSLLCWSCHDVQEMLWGPCAKGCIHHITKGGYTVT